MTQWTVWICTCTERMWQNWIYSSVVLIFKKVSWTLLMCSLSLINWRFRTIWVKYVPLKSGLRKKVTFKKKIKKNRIFFIKIRFFYLNQIFFWFFFRICCIYTENWTNFNRKENLMIIFFIWWYPYFQLSSLILILVDL